MAQLMDMEREKKFKSCVEVKVTEFFTEIQSGYDFIRSFPFLPFVMLQQNLFAFEINIVNIFRTWGKLAELKITDYFK